MEILALKKYLLFIPIKMIAVLLLLILIFNVTLIILLNVELEYLASLIVPSLLFMGFSYTVMLNCLPVVRSNLFLSGLTFIFPFFFFYIILYATYFWILIPIVGGQAYDGQAYETLKVFTWGYLPISIIFLFVLEESFRN